jgi:hypothetical protein
MHSKQEEMGGSGGGERARSGASEATNTTGIEAVSALTDDELLSGTRRLVCQSNRGLAALLAHLAEVEARGLHRTRACASLFTYCVYELRMSEDAAFRRVGAARLVKRFPELLGAVERGELHLTALLLLGPHLTETNVVEVLARAKFRTKKEVVKLVRLLSPLPDVPSRIEPLGLERPRLRPTWGNLLAARHPIRELPPDECPSNWLPASDNGAAAPFGSASDERMGGGVVMQSCTAAPARMDQAEKRFFEERDARAGADDSARRNTHALARIEAEVTPARIDEAAFHSMASRDAIVSAADTPQRNAHVLARIERAEVAPARIDQVEERSSASRDATARAVHGPHRDTHAPARIDGAKDAAKAYNAEADVAETSDHAAGTLSGPQRYSVQFTASEEYVALVEEAKALLAHALPSATLAEIHLRAMRTLVAELKKRRFAVVQQSAKSAARPQPTCDDRVSQTRADESVSNESILGRSVKDAPENDAARQLRTTALDVHAPHDDASNSTALPRQRVRTIPAAVRRSVFERDENRCAFVDARGVRCRETQRLELHHHEPFARGGPSTAENLSLYCSAHNALAAEHDFGRELAVAKRDQGSHFTERTLSRAPVPDA